MRKKRGIYLKQSTTLMKAKFDDFDIGAGKSGLSTAFMIRIKVCSDAVGKRTEMQLRDDKGSCFCHDIQDRPLELGNWHTKQPTLCRAKQILGTLF